MWSIPKFGNGNQQTIFVDLSSDEERRRMRCQDLSNAIAEMSKNCTREILLEPIQIDKFSISLEKLKINMKECYNCLVYYLKMMLWNLLKNCLK